MDIIDKPQPGLEVVPNLADYEACRASFSWESARSEFDGSPGGGLNIAHEAIDRHALSARANHAALRWLGKSGQVDDYSYARLRELTNRFANVLQKLGVGRSERVFTLVGRIPELYITALGALKNGCVFCPLFSAFGPEPIRARMTLGEAAVLVTTERLYGRKVAEIRRSLPSLKHVIIVRNGDEPASLPDTLDFYSLLDSADANFTVAPTDPEDMALLHFTSGTTGRPKGVVHVHAAVIAHYVSAKLALDLRRDDIFWCTADPGWVTGASYGIIAPLTIGATVIADEAEFDIERWCRILDDHRVSVWYTSPTALRMMMKYGSEIVGRYRYDKLRFLAAVGEALNPEAVRWGWELFGAPIHDTWWQTETGSIMIANFRSMPIKPGSMGKPLPGVEAAIGRRVAGGKLDLIDQPGKAGELVLRVGWPSMFRDYLGEETLYRKCFVDGWYLTGDLVKRDEDGYFWFVGRADDVINASGHLIGPFEVENILMEHPSVAEAAVIGKPDPVTAETVKAFVDLKPRFQATDRMRRELLAHARKRLGAAVAPKEIEFRGHLPKTRSGKIMRRLLKARELGLAEGDISALANEGEQSE